MIIREDTIPSYGSCSASSLIKDDDALLFDDNHSYLWWNHTITTVATEVFPDATSFSFATDCSLPVTINETDQFYIHRLVQSGGLTEARWKALQVVWQSVPTNDVSARCSGFTLQHYGSKVQKAMSFIYTSTFDECYHWTGVST
jgi:hypothetical protein